MNRVKYEVRWLLLVAGILLLLGALRLWLPLSTRLYILSPLLIPLVFSLTLLVLGVRLFRMTIGLVASGQRPPAFVVALDEQGVFRTLWDIFRRQRFKAGRLRFLFLTWSILLLGVVMLLKTTGRFDGAEVRVGREFWGIRNEDSVSSVGVFSYSAGDNNPTRYLQDLARLVTDFKFNGARVIVAREPMLFETKSIRAKLLDSLRRSGIVVLYESWPYRENDYYPAYTHSATRNYTYFPPIKIASNVPPLDLFDYSYMTTWHPCAYNFAWLLVDVALPVTAKFLGYPDTLRPVCEPDRVLYSGLTIPVSSNGRALTLNDFRFNRAYLGFGAGRDLDSDTMQYYSFTHWKVSSTFPVEYAPAIKGKIVIVEWLGGNDYSNFGRDFLYANVIESLLHDRVLRIYEVLPVLLAGIVIAISALFCYRMKFRIAVPLIVGLGCLLFAGSTWVLQNHYVLLNMAYPAAAAVLSAVIFPLVRLSHENP